MVLKGFGVDEHLPTGLAWHKGVLYMVGKTNEALYTLNPKDGMVFNQISLAALGIANSLNTQYPEGLASDERNLYILCVTGGEGGPIGVGSFPKVTTRVSTLYQVDPDKCKVPKETPVLLNGSRRQAIGLCFDGVSLCTFLNTGLGWEPCTLDVSNGHATIAKREVTSIISTRVHFNGCVYEVGKEKDAYLCVKDSNGKVLLPKESLVE